jgi:serine protease Do
MNAKKTGFIAGAVAGAGIAAAALAGAGLHWPAAFADQRGEIVRTSAATAPMFAPAPGAPLSFADIFERVAPAVVSIDVTSRAERRAAGRVPGFEGFPFNIPTPRGQQNEDDEDDSEGGGAGGAAQPQLPEARATGSGFFISPDGYVVTNNHVIENATEITVRMTDKRELKARVIGRDEGTDLAVLKVDGGRFPYVSFENQAKPRVGDWVIAVGNPFDLGGTATAGIISAYGRDIGESFVDYLQIDAPINRGNSGGPTFDIYGRVVGVNTAIFSPTGGSVGIGFAVPADIADSITKQLISGGKITRGYLGVSIQNVTPEIAESLGIPPRTGALVADVTEGGPAAKAGVESGDVILNVNGKAVGTANELTRQVALARAGDILRLEVRRGGRNRIIEVRSGTRPSESELNRSLLGERNDNGPATPAPEVNRTTVLGLGLVPLDAAARTRYSLPATARGVVIDNVATGSDAARRGLRRGDLILQANERAVATPAEVATAVADARRAGRPSVLLLVSRQGRTLAVPLKFDEATPPAGPTPTPPATPRPPAR